MPERFTSKRWLSFFFGWLLLLLVLQGAHAYFSRQTALQIVEANRIEREKTEVFKRWAATFRRIEGRQVAYMSAIKGDIPAEEWAQIEEINGQMRQEEAKQPESPAAAPR
jgi:hypothetical protein